MFHDPAKQPKIYYGLLPAVCYTMAFLCGMLDSSHSALSLIFLLMAVMGLAWIYAWHYTHFLISAAAALWLPLAVPRAWFWAIDVYSPEGGALSLLEALSLDFGMTSRACYVAVVCAAFTVTWLYARFERNWAARYRRTFIPWGWMMEKLGD